MARLAFFGLGLVATIWLGSRPVTPPTIAEQDLPVVENADYDVISSFAPLSDLSQAQSDDDDSDVPPQQPQQM